MKKITLSLLALAASAMMATAQAPSKFNFQGIARNVSGSPLSSTPLGMRISIHDGSSTGTIVYQETHSTTTNAYGLYNVVIGNGSPSIGTLSSVPWGSGDKYIQVEVDPAGGTTYTDLGASQLLSVPYALNAGSGAGLTGTGTTNYIPKYTAAGTLGNSAIYQTPGGKLGIGTTSPFGKVQINNSTDTVSLLISSTYNGSTAYGALRVENSSTSTTQPVAGILATAIPSTTVNAGTAITGFGGNVGVAGQGQSNSTGTAQVFGVSGNAFSQGITVGVYGEADNYTTTVAGTKYGVYGIAQNGTTNYAGYFVGNTAVTGLLSKGGGSFKIDHPLDPENKYLYHSFVESPEMMNIYNGNITTDANGFATVTMPSYFDALNKDFRYQLTVMGTFAQAIVKEKMSSNQFVIQTSQPNVEVSWMVTGVRHDKFADAHRIEAEVEKEQENKGKYIHPLEWNQPVTKEINYKLNHPKKNLDTSKIHAVGE